MALMSQIFVISVSVTLRLYSWLINFKYIPLDGAVQSDIWYKLWCETYPDWFMNPSIAILCHSSQFHPILWRSPSSNICMIISGWQWWASYSISGRCSCSNWNCEQETWGKLQRPRPASRLHQRLCPLAMGGGGHQGERRNELLWLQGYCCTNPRYHSFEISLSHPLKEKQ